MAQVFKVGDRIRNKGLGSGVNAHKMGTVTFVTEFSPRPTYGITYDDGNKGEGEAEYYELINKKGIMKTLSLMMKRLLDSDTQTLVKAGYITSDLELTEYGEDALITILFLMNKAELVKMAQAELDDSAKEKK